MNIFDLIDRDKALFETDLSNNSCFLLEEVSKSRFLVIGGAGSIGQSVVKELFKRNPAALYVVDLSENNLTELVRDLRSSYGYIDGKFNTYAIDCGSYEFECFFKEEHPFDYVINLSALKHVRSERDKYTLMRMIDVNILNTIKTLKLAIKSGVKKYFCVSTDKAANPVNMMGASKRIMEMFLIKYSKDINISTARFANVAFSDGSLLSSFKNRIEKKQPIVAPVDVKRYFVTLQESGELCLMSALIGNNRDIFFPKLTSGIKETSFSEIANKFLKQLGYGVLECKTESEVRNHLTDNLIIHDWPCLFTKSDTTGEKLFEEFYSQNEILDIARFESLGVVKYKMEVDEVYLDYFVDEINRIKKQMIWSKEELVALFKEGVPNFLHDEVGKNLDEKL
jgi:FlaA1/EpsC-like NDP-sugar epimerase